MKKLFFMAAAIVALASCSSDDQLVQKESEQGTIVLNLGVDETVQNVTRAEQTVTDFSNWEVQIVKVGETDETWVAYDAAGWTVPYGEYVVKVRNHNGPFTAKDNEGKGIAVYEGQANVTMSQAENAVTVNCGTQQTSQVAVVFEESFTNTFTAYAMGVTDANVSGRTYSTEVTTEHVAYLQKDGDTKAGVTYKLIGTMNGQSGQKVLSSITDPIRIDAAKKLVLTVKASSTNGKITLTITYDDTVTEQTEDVIIDPTTWSTLPDNTPAP